MNTIKYRSRNFSTLWLTKIEYRAETCSMKIYAVSRCISSSNESGYLFRLMSVCGGVYVKQAFLKYSGEELLFGDDYVLLIEAQINNETLIGQIIAAKSLSGLRRDFL